ncbi:MAG: homogentisate 1,2-dioxygenase [Sporichthyaceae bacterium]
MPHYRVAGEIPPKRHTQFRQSDGSLLREELMGAEGFSADSALLYHAGDPAAILASRAWELLDQTLTPNHPLLPRHLRLPDLVATEPSGIDAVTGRRLVLGNHDVRISYVVAGAPSPLYRDAVGDECVFVEAGTAFLETVFGHFEVARGDYLMIPRGTTHRWIPSGVEPVRLYLIEASSHIGPPRRYLSARGQFLEHAPYCERDLRAPQGPSQIWDTDVEVYVKHRGPAGLLGSILTHATHPFDLVGWDGCLYPYAVNVADFEPITGRIHQPPPVHQVFEGANFVICNFVPRKVDYHPLAVPVPYHHSNVDSDEVMFYVAGNYAARSGSGIAAGSVSLHPGGHTHGPQPGSAERSLGAERFDELAIMVDTFAPLGLGEGALACEDQAYAWTWANNGPRSAP